MRSGRVLRWTLPALVVAGACVAGHAEAPDQPPSHVEPELLQLLDAPLLFVKRHSYSGIHIYDTYYKWPPGGGGIYVLENPAAPRAAWKIRPVIDPTTSNTLGVGVYSDPELSWDAQKVLFCFKGEPTGSTSIYEIGIDGRGLRRLTDPTPSCDCHQGSGAGQHDLTPAYLPDGRIIFLSTRFSGLVPCNNTGVAILHVMNADGSDIHATSVNNVNEFDPSVLPDGRVLYGRWEYVDKNALTIQSLWTVHPDGTHETALYANNMVFPEAILDARPVPGSQLVAGTLAKHNSVPRGSIALIDPRRGKNNPQAITNLEHPENPTFDRGDSCEPWPLSEDVVLLSGRPPKHSRNIIQLLDRTGRRIEVLSDPEICLHSPMLVKPRPRPPVIPDVTDRQVTTGRFFVQDIYQGMPGVKPGEVKWLRAIEETSRTSARPDGKNPYNQTFLVSSALAFSVKNFLGVVPVDESGSAYFEVPAGKAVYFQALDADGRLVQSMRSFVQAAPGTTRSCIGCHVENGSTTPGASPADLLGRAPVKLRPESWGSGLLDYPSRVQPVLEKHCVRCHGGQEGIAAGMDLSGGWTEHFSISYESLTNRRETQLTAYWIAGIDCMNGTAPWSSQLFPPRSHGSGAAPLAELLVSGHEDRIAQMTRAERDLLMAWIDTNGLYHGTWDYTHHGSALAQWDQTKNTLVARMQSAGCLRCHGDGKRISYFENDWINLKNPEFSRILRAALPADSAGFGLGLCRERKVDPRRQRIHLLWKGYAHAVQPPEAFPRHPLVPADPSGQPFASFASPADPNYQAMLAIITKGRERALAAPRVDMPGAEIIAGSCRHLIPLQAPNVAPPLQASCDEAGVVVLTWQPSAQTVGLHAEIHRSSERNFTPNDDTLLGRTSLFRYADEQAAAGRQHYALVLISDSARSEPARAAIDVPPPPQPPVPTDLSVTPWSGSIRLAWQSSGSSLLGYHVDRRQVGTNELERITTEPISQTQYADLDVEIDQTYAYEIRAISRRGVESRPTARVEATAVIIREPVFTLALNNGAGASLIDGSVLPAQMHGKVRIEDGAFDLRQGGHASFPHQEEFDLTQPLSVECWVRFDKPGKMPVIVSCGHWNSAGWFLQRLGNTWRWHVGGVDCDGGRPAEGRWIHLAATYDGRTARLYEDGVEVGRQTGEFNRAPWPGELHVGQYSGQPGPDYQVTGHIADLKIYHRPLGADEISAAGAGRPK